MTRQIAVPSSESQVARALVVDFGETKYTPAPELNEDTIVNLQVLAVSQFGASTIGLTGGPQRSTNLVGWTHIPGSTATVLTLAPGLKRKRVDGVVSGYIRVQFDNTGPGNFIVRSQLATTTAPA
jgi:hypothetical protein